MATDEPSHPPSNQSPPDGAPPLCLDQFLKLCGLVSTGGQAKLLIQGGEVQVNGEVETRRRKKLSPSDVVELGGERAAVKDYL
jgi:ribosome-associated protein